MSAGQQQPQVGQQGRQRWVIGAVACCVLGAAAVLADVLSVQVRGSKDASGSSSAQPLSDNVLDALAQLNAMPTLLAVPAAEEASSAPATVTPVVAGAGAGADGSLTFADPGPVQGSESTLDTIKDLINSAKAPAAGGATAPGPAPAGALTTRGWAAIGSGRNTICYPTNGTEVVQMTTAKSPCTVIVLTRSSREPYNIKEIMNITTTKVIVGNPIDMPALNGSKVERLFYVGPGGRLDIRAVTLFKGSGRKLDDGRLKLTIGASAYVALGGVFTATGVLFREKDQTVEQVMEEARHILDWRSRNLGSHIFVAGGNLYLNGCYFIRLRLLGNFILNNVQLGRDILVVAGNAVLSGVYNLNANLFANNVVVGNVFAVLGGTGVWAGGTLCNVAGAQAQWGAGIQMFVGGGVLVNAGFNYISVNGALMRGAFGLFTVGGGVHIQTGYLQARAWATGSINNAGQTFSVGGGIHQMVGGAIATSSIANVFFGAGGTAFVGSGQLRWIGVAQARCATAQTQYGVGLVMYNGAGTTNFIFSPQTSAQVARAQFCAGNDIFLGAGWHTSVNNTRLAAQLVNAFYGVGNQIWVGAGGAAFIRVYTSTRRGWGFSTTRFLYTIAGTGVTTQQGRENIVVTKSGRKVLPFQPTPQTPKRGLFFQSLPPRPPQPAVRTLSEAEQQSAQAVDSLAVQLLMGKTVEKAGQNAFFNPQGRSKLLMVDSFMQEGKQQIIEDPAAFQAPELKNVFGGLPTILAQRAKAGLDKPVTVSGAPVTFNPGIVSVNNTDCMLCSVGPGPTAEHMGGPDSCHVSDACGGTGSPAQALEKARAAAPAGFDLAGVPGLNGLSMVRAADGEAELPDIHLLWHELVVYCRSTDPTVPSSSITDTCLSANYVKDAVRAFLGPEHADDYQLAVASAGLHPVVKPLVEAEGLLPAAMQPAWNAECQGWTKFNVYMTANDAAVRDFLAQQWQAIVAEPDDLEATLLENSDRNAKVTPCSVRVKRVGGTTYPSIKYMKGFKPLTSELAPVGPSVTLAADSAIAPVMEVAEGKEHTIFVQNFMKGSKISLQLVKGLDRVGPVIAAIDSFDDAAGPGGLTALKWTPPAGLKAMEKPGEINKYYLKASVDAFPAFFANSQAFTLAAAVAGAGAAR